MKTAVAVLSISILVTASIGCRDTGIKSDRARLHQILTLYEGYAREFPQVAEITVPELQQRQQQGAKVVLVDVRTPEERAVSVIPGAISQEEFEGNLHQYRDSLIVAYCTIGYRSGKYAQSLQQRGIEVFNLPGSLLAWSHFQGELTNATGITNQIHVFDRQWQLTAKDYQPVW